MKSIKIAYIILKIYLSHFLLGVIIFGTDWVTNPISQSDLSLNSTSTCLLYLAIIFYLFPLISMYERAVKRNYAEKRLGDLINDVKAVEISPETIYQLQRKAAESGECDCARCTEIRAEIAAENEKKAEKK